jgi:solute carrier family 25 phosphate transporter 3
MTVMTSSSSSHSTFSLYCRYGLAGACCASFTHAVLTPIDVVKTRIQLEPNRYQSGLYGGLRQIAREEGSKALLTGLGPTVVGYFLQGALKFGGYEIWKQKAIEYYGIEFVRSNRLSVYLCSSAIAEFVSDIALCPLESTRIRLVSQPTFANGMLSGMKRILKEEGFIKGFYSGFVPILLKQIPYTMTQFAVQELTSEWTYKTLGKSRSESSNITNSCVSVFTGLLGGAASAVTSHPADTLLSKINKSKSIQGESIMKRLINTSRELGFVGLFTGLGPRVLMVGLMSSMQFLIFFDIKRILGATGGIEIQKIDSRKSSSTLEIN